MLSLLAALLLAILPDTPTASETGSVSGTVIEAFSGHPLPGARVAVGDASTLAGPDGRYSLQIRSGAWSLGAEAPGHRSVSRPIVVSPGGTQTIDIYLQSIEQERARFREQVDVSAAADRASTPAAELTVAPAEVNAVAGAADNVFRALQTLPGVAGTEEFGSRITVRGGGPDENLTIMDGVEIHNPYRLFGLTSAFNPETIASFELSTGGFGAKYGDRLSSLLLVENRDGNAARRLTGSSALSVTDANVVLEGRLPGGKTGAWLVTGRRTYYDLFAERFTNSDLPSFGDLQARVVWEPRPGQRLTAFAVRSREATNARFEGDRAGEQGNFVSAARNDLASLRFDATLGPRARTRSIASFYRNTDRLDADARFRNDARRSNSADDDTAFALANVAFTRDLTVRDAALRQELAFQSSPRNLLEAGFELHALATGVGWNITGDRNQSQANGSSQRGGSGLPSLLDSSRDADRVGAYLQDRYQIVRRVVVEPGLRYDRSGVNGRATWSPRLSATLGLSEVARVKAAVGRFTQSPGYEKLIQSDYFLDLSGSGRIDLDAERADHVILGFERDLGPGLLLRAEAYYKHFDRLIVGRLETEAERLARVATYDFPASLSASIPASAQITSTPVNGASGRAWGFDLYATRRATTAATRLTGWASYTFGKAERDAYGRTLPFEYDRRHALSLVADYKLGVRWDLGATARVASGFPRTPVLGLRVAAVADAADLDRDGNRTELVPARDPAGLLVYTPDLGGVANLNTARLPLFARVDLRATFRPRGEKGRFWFYLDIINVLARKNVGAYEAKLIYDPTSDRPRLVEDPGQSIPFLPSFGIRFRF